MLSNKLSKDDEKTLRDYANQLPLVWTNTLERHRMTGQELIEMGYVEQKGQKINPEEKYIYNSPVQIAANHYRRLKRAWLKHGAKGIATYLLQVRKLMDQHERA
jgi:hypothetical protein